MRQSGRAAVARPRGPLHDWLPAMTDPIRLPPAASGSPGAKNVLEFLRLLWAIDHALQGRSKRMVRELGVTGPQRLVIRVLGHQRQATSGELATLLHLHPSTLSGIVRRLQRSGFVARSVDATDRRRYHLARRETIAAFAQLRNHVPVTPDRRRPCCVGPVPETSLTCG